MHIFGLLLVVVPGVPPTRNHREEVQHTSPDQILDLYCARHFGLIGALQHIQNGDASGLQEEWGLALR